MIERHNWLSAYHLSFIVHGGFRLLFSIFEIIIFILVIPFSYKQLLLQCMHCLESSTDMSNFFSLLLSIDRHLNILVLADLLVALLMRTLQLVEQMVQHADNRQIPDWQRGESGHNDIEITWAEHIYILLQTYQKAMVWQLAEKK